MKTFVPEFWVKEGLKMVKELVTERKSITETKIKIKFRRLIDEPRPKIFDTSRKTK